MTRASLDVSVSPRSFYFRKRITSVIKDIDSLEKEFESHVDNIVNDHLLALDDLSELVANEYKVRLFGNSGYIRPWSGYHPFIEKVLYDKDRNP